MRQHQCVPAAEIPPAIPMGGSSATARATLALLQPWTGRRLLWVDDSRALLSLYKSVFESLGFEVLATSSPDEALEHVSSNAPDVAILDYDMPGMDGGMLASLIKDRYPVLPVILYSGSTGIPLTAHYWVDAICAKTAPREELLTMIALLSRKASAAHGAESPRSFTPSSNH
jgi:two-component system, sensor histidine kinase LadS